MQSRDVGLTQIYENSEFGKRSADENATISLEQVQKVCDLRKKHAEISAQFEAKQVNARLCDTLTSIAIQTPINVVATVLDAGVTAKRYGMTGSFASLFQ